MQKIGFIIVSRMCVVFQALIFYSAFWVLGGCAPSITSLISQGVSAYFHLLWCRKLARSRLLIVNLRHVIYGNITSHCKNASIYIGTTGVLGLATRKCITRSRWRKLDVLVYMYTVFPGQLVKSREYDFARALINREMLNQCCHHLRGWSTSY